MVGSDLLSQKPNTVQGLRAEVMYTAVMLTDASALATEEYGNKQKLQNKVVKLVVEIG